VAKTGKALGGAGFDMGKLLGAQITHAKDIIPNLFEELEDSAGVANITAGLAKMNEMLDPSSPVGQRVVAGLDGLLNRFGKLVKEIDFDVWSGRIVKAFDYIGDAMEVAASVFNALGATFEFVMGMSAEMGESLYNMTVGVADAVKWVDDALNSLLAPLYKADAAMWAAVKQFFDWGLGIGKALWQGIKEGIVGHVTEVVDSVKFLGKEIIGGITSVLKTRSPSEVFSDIGMQTAAGFSLGIAAAIPGVRQTMEEAFAPMSLLPVVPALGTGLGSGSGPITTVVSAGGGGGQAGPHLEAHVTVNLGPGTTDENVARQVGEYSKLGVMEALESLLSQLAAEGGAA
jgi:hypothetical protein